MAFIIDDLLFAPLKGLAFLGRKIQETATEELLDDDGTRRELRVLYDRLDNGEISEQEFESREELLIERLEQIQEFKNRSGK